MPESIQPDYDNKLNIKERPIIFFWTFNPNPPQ